jgi:hypothetical protein
LRLFVDAQRERDDLTAATPSALASDLDYRADACELVTFAHVLLLSGLAVQIDANWTSFRFQTGSKGVATLLPLVSLDTSTLYT